MPATNSTLAGQPPAESGFDYGICVGCMVAIVLAQAPTHSPTQCWTLPPLQQSVLRTCAARATEATSAERMTIDITEQLQQVGVLPEMVTALVDGLRRWLTGSDTAAST